MAKVNEIRRAFLDYFVKHDHNEVNSSPLVPLNDPTLMFTNAGMVQFKNLFTGVEKRNYTQAVTSQKCVRAGGKHNDLENVGYTARHHTFFEMLGNFSFGDYFKERAITLAWELITKDFGLDKNKLLVTVYSEDEEAAKLWKKIAGFKDDKIIRIATSDNFWSMGETGPCGPCSEIFYDHGDHIPGGPPGTPEEDGDRFIEIWNLVFMQFEQVSADKRTDLPSPSIDTGMGLERIAAVLQGTHDNYEIDLFKTLIGASVDLTGVKAEGDHKASHRVIADHLRASSFLMADGVLPSNEGRGYVLRRIMRRAMRHAHLLGAKDPLMHRLFPTLLSEMGEAYPELHRAKALISDTLRREEIRFRETLARGLKLLEDETKSLKAGDELSGLTAFKLYDTYGFPLDLTEDALRVRKITVDKSGFETAMEKQKQDARAAWAGSGDSATESQWFDIRETVGPTDFIGYEHTSSEGQIKQVVKDGKPVKQLKKGDEGQIILNQTVFYGESGGQVGDTGQIRTSNGLFEVIDTKKKLGDLLVHFGKVVEGAIKPGDEAHLQVLDIRRKAIRANHSATHLLHEALRYVLGDHVAQKGSLVSGERLRFDFSHPKPVLPEEIVKIEKLANQMILQNSPVETRLMAVDDAIKAGATALFGEKYGDEVRVVTMGYYEDDHKIYSMELCGGTHVNRTGDIGLCKLVSEGAVASGVRRIEALTGERARDYLNERDAILRTMSENINAPVAQLPDRLISLVNEKKKLERDLREAKKQLAFGSSAAGTDQPVEEIGKVKFLGRVVEGINPKDLRGMVDEGKQKLESGIVAVITRTEEGKAGLVVGVTADLTNEFSAVELVRIGAGIVGGKGGGGRDDMAQAGGPDGQAAEKALQAIKQKIAS